MDKKTTRTLNVLFASTLALGVMALVVAAIHVAIDHTFPGYALVTAAIGFFVSWGHRHLVRSATTKPAVGPPESD